MFSVTSDAATTLSVQAAPSRSTRPDPSQGTDRFGALVDSNTAADTGNDRAPATAPDQPAPPRRADDTSPPADNRRSLGAASPNQTAKNDSDNPDAAVGQHFDTKTDSSTDAVAQLGSKPNGAKPAAPKSTAKLAADGSSVTPPTDPATALQIGTVVMTPVAVAIAAPVALTDVPTTPPASGNASEPLAIAAAALAASAAVSSAQVKPDSSAAASAGVAATASDLAAAATSQDITANAKVDAQAAVSETVNPPKPQTAAAAVTATDLPIAVAAKPPVTAKAATPKTPTVAQTGAVPSGDTEAASDTPDPSATVISTGPANNTVAQQLAAAAGKPKTPDGVVDAVKANDSSPPSTSSAALSPHGHLAAGASGNAPAVSSDAGVQAAGTVQSQLQSAAVAAAPLGPLSVTAAIPGAVPVSGLALEIAVSAQSGKSRFEIRLDPADLGRIDVRIDVDRNGVVTSHLTVEKPETLSMLRQDAPQLQRALEDAGIKTGSDGLQFSLRDQSSSSQNDGGDTARNAQRLVVSEEDTIPAAVAGRSYGRMLGSSSGVDIRV